MKSSAAVIFSLSLIVSTAAHGWVGTLTIGSKSYKGNQPAEQVPNGAPSVVRQIANNLPVKDTTSPDLTCGRNAQRGALVASAAAGDTVLLDWATESGNWFHDVGPMMAYLANCGAESCADFDTGEARWFKIAEQGLEEDGSWAQAKLDDGSPARVTLPADLKAGNYLLRYEIVALHTAQSVGGAEFYPSCSQLKVTGNGSGAPKESELVSLPGAYKKSDRGILVDVYNMGGGAYQFPGPPVAAFVKGSSSSSPSSPSFTSISPSTTKNPSSTKTCKNKGKRSGSGDAPLGAFVLGPSEKAETYGHRTSFASAFITTPEIDFSTTVSLRFRPNAPTFQPRALSFLCSPISSRTDQASASRIRISL
ncbi:glycosyl hydrolase family 61-domain-containing protein [Mycena leptocephala]|nr:glycosyl hydrolase family 61-domain-containing protein [Mycena leptocephala]